MGERNGIGRLSDRNALDLLDHVDTPFVILFESRYDLATLRMVEAFQTALESLDPDILRAICMVEDAPLLSNRFEIYGVPTIVAGMGDSVLGKSLGTKTAEELRALFESWLHQGTAQGKTKPRRNHGSLA